jgi:hemerythrin
MLRDWSDDYAFGIQAIDAQHFGFFEATHRLHDAVLNCEGEKSVEECVEFLRNYAARHFQAEEELMQTHGFPGLARHKQLHIRFFESLDLLVDDLRISGPSQDLADRVLEVAQDWLLNHIIDEDSAYVSYVRQPSVI